MTDEHHLVGRYLAFITLALLLIVVSLTSYWVLAPTDELIVKNGPVPIRPANLHAGESAILTYDYCKTTDQPGMIRTSIVSSKSELFLPLANESSKKHCDTKLDVPVIIPPQAVPDYYHFHFRATYQLNPLRSVTVQWDSQTFKVE